MPDESPRLSHATSHRTCLPVDAKFTAVARGVQLTGIMLCLAAGRDLTHCPCFIELALNETKDRVKKILTAALDDWTNLASFPAPEHATNIT